MFEVKEEKSNHSHRTRRLSSSLRTDTPRAITRTVYSQLHRF